MSEIRPCSLGVLGWCNGPKKTKQEFSADEWSILKARSGIGKLRRVCERHQELFLKYYTLTYKTCLDPMNKHTKPVQGLREITLKEYKASRSMPRLFKKDIIPGQKVCKRCSSELLLILSILPEKEDTPTSSFSSSQRESQDIFSDAQEEDQKNVGDDLECPNQTRFKDMQKSQDVGEIDHGIDQTFLKTPTTSEQKGNTSGETKEFVSPETNTFLPESQGNVADDEQEDSQPSLSSETVVSSGEQFLPPDEAIEMVNASLKALDESPLNKRKISGSKYAMAKLRKTEDKMEKLMRKGGASGPSFNEEKIFCEQVIKALQYKFQNSNSMDEKISALSVALTGLSLVRVSELFGPLGATDWLIRKASKLTEEQGIFPKAAPKKGRGLSEVIKTKVISFYESDINSRQLPGKRDFVVVRENGKKSHVQKKLILSNLRELYESFRIDNPGINVSFSKFAALRPQHCVLAGSTGTHSICVCKYHQNMKLLVECVDFKSLDNSLVTYKDFLLFGLCSPPSAACFLQQCQECPGYNALEDHLDDMLSESCIEEVSYGQWTTQGHRATLETFTKKRGPYLEEMMSKLKELAPHHFVTKQQAQYLRDLKESLQPGEAVTICDFSENYTFIIQDSIQSFYFSSSQATIHPFVTYYLDSEGNLCILSYVIISEFMKHNVNSFYTFQKNHIEYLKKIVPGLKKVHYWSDGAGSQYKNVFNMLNLTYHKEDFGVKAIWNFFATSHGKGPSDGVGGTLKRCAARASIQGVRITTPLEFFKWAQEAMPNIVVAYVSNEDVAMEIAFLTPRFERAIAIDSLTQFHQFSPLSCGELNASRFSTSEDQVYAPAEKIRKVPQFESINIGDFLAVHISKRTWRVTQVSNIELATQEILAVRLDEVRAKPGSRTCGYALPENGVEEKVQLPNILAILEPIKVPNRHFYELSVRDRLRVNWQLKLT